MPYQSIEQLATGWTKLWPKSSICWWWEYPFRLRVGV